MRRTRGVFKKGVFLGLVFALMLSGTACGKEEVLVDDYGSESDVVSQDTASDSESDSESETESDTKSDTEMISGDGHSLTEIFGDNITVDETFSVGGITADINVNYKVPEVSQINVYESSFIKNDSDIEKQIVNNFFGGTEKNLDEIKYENDSDYIPLLYKYRSILMYQNLGISAYSAEAVLPADANEYLSVIDSSFDKVYNWVDEVNYYIHMYEGEYNGNRYGMIYYYDMANSKRNIYISPISMTEYFPDFDAKTIFVVDQKSDFGSDNLCSMSEADVAKEAGDVVEKLGLNMKDIILSTNPNMAEPQVGMTGTFPEDNNAEMPKLVFSDSNMMSSIQKLNSTNPTGRTYAYKLLKEQTSEQVQADNVNFSVNGYSIYLCSAPFSENVMPQPLSSFNRGSIYYTDKGLYSLDITMIAEIDNTVEGVQLLSFDNIKESLKRALENDPDISQRSSASLEVTNVDFTYVLIEDGENHDKVTYVPAWYFTTKDNKLKAGEGALTYSHVINALDGSDLRDSIR